MSCRFYAQGTCRSGNACRFIHEAANEDLKQPKILALPAKNPIESTGAVPMKPSTVICRFFAQGVCKRGNECHFVHSTAVRPPQPNEPTVSFSMLKQEDRGNVQIPSDSRAKIPCKFMSSATGCQKDFCPYSHSADRFAAGNDHTQNAQEEEDQDNDEDLSRDLLGASVCFNEFGEVLKVSLPSDFSFARVTGFARVTNVEAIGAILNTYGFQLPVDCIRLHGSVNSDSLTATVKFDGPLLARDLCATVNTPSSGLTAVVLSTNIKRKDARKVHISWHKASRSVWLNFGNEATATRVARRFNEGKYKCLNQSIRSTEATVSASAPFRRNPVACTITLSGVPSKATRVNLEHAIFYPQDKPRHIEMGRVSYQASEPEVSIAIRKQLEKFGPLEGFTLRLSSTGKRQKATALFEDEAAATSACSLNDQKLDIIGNSKITVTQIQSFKVKLATKIYLAIKYQVDEACKTWQQMHTRFHVYQDTSRRFTTLKLEAEKVKDLADARAVLENILSGETLASDGVEIWHPSLTNNVKAMQMVNSIEKELDVVIVRDKIKSQLKFYGPSGKRAAAVRRASEVVRTLTHTTGRHEITLEPDEFSWAVHGGLKDIVQHLGEGVAFFDVVSRRIMINGNQQQYTKALQIMKSRGKEVLNQAVSDTSPSEECPICLDTPDTPVATSCKHVYCLTCFEQCCASATPTETGIFRIKCYGAAGTCAKSFTLQEVREHLSSSELDDVLRTSFSGYIQSHSDLFRYCPTPDCGWVYRCSTVSTSSSANTAHTCPNCAEDICISCHAQHGQYTCAEYKDIASGGFEALRKLKLELNIKDCPKCSTPMEKTDGCNHMTCGGCKAHICWVCMAVFAQSDFCYKHMRETHGGIGLDFP